MWPEFSSVKAINLVKKIYYNIWDNEFFLRGCFLLAHPVHKHRERGSEKNDTIKNTHMKSSSEASSFER